MAHVGQTWRLRLRKNVADHGGLVVAAQFVKREVPELFVCGIKVPMVFAVAITSRVAHPDVEAFICKVESHRVTVVTAYAGS